MNRLSLIRNLNQVAAICIALILWVALLVLRAPGLQWSVDRVRREDTFLVPLILLGAYFLSRAVNKTYLPNIVRSGTYWKYMLLCAGYVYSLCFLLSSYYYWRDSQFGAGSIVSIVFGALYMPAFYLLWLAPVTIPLTLFAGLVMGYVFQFLYTRRDYLPEEL